jgi:hypothetical protein
MNLFPSSFPTRTLYLFLISSMRATYSSHVIFVDLKTLQPFSRNSR